MLLPVGQCRTGQDRTGQVRAVQGRAGQGSVRAGQGRTVQVSAGQGRRKINIKSYQNNSKRRGQEESERDKHEYVTFIDIIL